MPVLDRLNRPLRDLRISVTDRCNFRCVYCMPREVFGPGYKFMQNMDILSFEDIERVARAAAKLGVEKIRLTGGEPLIRGGIEHLVEKLANIPGIKDIALTTNGSQLARHAKGLKKAGLDRITVSLDALDPKLFREICDVKVAPEDIHAGIQAASDVGMQVKINMVVKKGMNESEIIPMAEHFRNSGHILRFIEFMDVGSSNEWKKSEVITAAQIQKRLDAQWPLEAVDPNYIGEVAQRYRYKDGAGEVGFITSISQPFCSTCSRARLSADGKIFTCLFAQNGFDLTSFLAQPADNDDAALVDCLKAVWQQRSDRYSEIRALARKRRGGKGKIEMSYIGG